MPADPGRDRTCPEAFPRLAGAPNPPSLPRAPQPDFRKFAKNSPHEFSRPADPRWRRIHRGDCWEQDLYPLTPAVTPVAQACLKAAAEARATSGVRARTSRDRNTSPSPPEKGDLLEKSAIEIPMEQFYSFTHGVAMSWN
ncbi:uncharacterized protein PS065_005651 [Dugong dugon]